MIKYPKYTYVGPQEILDNLGLSSMRLPVIGPDSVLGWIASQQQEFSGENSIVATFIIDTDLRLWINDRRSEHVLCAAGQPVLAAGEITFLIQDETVEIIEITNQSTGYCPPLETWSAVVAAITPLNIAFPSEFTSKYIFRLCDACGTRNIVKDDWYICSVCDADLSQEWNFDSQLQ